MSKGAPKFPPCTFAGMVAQFEGPGFTFVLAGSQLNWLASCEVEYIRFETLRKFDV